MMQGISLVMDCTDTRQLAKFWQAVVGGAVNDHTASDEWVALEGIPQFDYLGFQRVPEGKTAKNRTHIDVMVESVEAGRDNAIEHGAAAIGDIVEQQIFRFQVMTDPEGNEFCFVQRKALGA
ncbi:MAG: VOC family protein [Ilumatobacteraceae bacterium]|jgi:predicted enzyme related to lactoylglutathione lyase